MRKQETLTKVPSPNVKWGGGGKIGNLAKKSGSKTILKAVAAIVTGGLLAITPMAMAQSTPPEADGVEFEEVTTGGSPNFWIVDQSLSPGVETVIITTPAPASPGSVAVLGGSDETWDNESNPFKHLNISGASHGGGQLGGFRFQTNTSAVAFEGGLFGGSITVSNSVGDAYGAVFYNRADDSAADISGIIDITGTINVKSTATGFGATGFVAGTLLNGSEVSIGNIIATATEPGTHWATGVQILGTDTGSLLTVGSLDVNAAASASGIITAASAEGKIEVGQIDVTGDWRAVGIFIGQEDANGTVDASADANELVLKGNINVKGSHNAEAGQLGGYAAVGVLVGGDAYIELDGDVNIKATATAVANNETAAIHTGGYLALNLMGNALTTENDINVENLMVFSAYENKSGDWVALDGTFKAGDVTVGGDADFWSVDNTTLNLEAENFTVTTGDLTLEAWDGGIINATVGTVNVNDLGLYAGEGGVIDAVVDTVIVGGDLDLYAEEGGQVFAVVNSLNVDGDLYLYGDVETGGYVQVGVNFGNSAPVGGHGFASGNVTIIAGGEMDVDETGFVVLDIDAEHSVQLLNRAIFTGYGWDEMDEYGKYDIRAYRLTKANLQDEFFAAGMIHNRLTGYNMVRDRFISGNARSGSGLFRGQAHCDPCAPVGPCDEIACNPCDPCGPFGGRGLSRSSGIRNAWISYVGRGDTYGSWDIGSNGIQAGSDLFRTNRTQFGVIFGYEDGKAERVNGVSSGRIDSKDTYGGIYAARVLRSGADVRFVYNYGQQKFDMTRTYWDQPFKSNFKGRTHEINLELGKRLHSGAWSIRPYAALDFYSMRLGKAVETPVLAGDNPSLTYDKTSMTQIFLRPGFDVRLQGKRATFNTGMSYAADLNDSLYKTNVTGNPAGVGTIKMAAHGTKMGSHLVNFNIGGDLKLGRASSVFGGYDMQAVVDRSGGVQHVGHVGGAVKW